MVCIPAEEETIEYDETIPYGMSMIVALPRGFCSVQVGVATGLHTHAEQNLFIGRYRALPSISGTQPTALPSPRRPILYSIAVWYWIDCSTPARIGRTPTLIFPLPSPIWGFTTNASQSISRPALLD